LFANTPVYDITLLMHDHSIIYTLHLFSKCNKTKETTNKQTKQTT